MSAVATSRVSTSLTVGFTSPSRMSSTSRSRVATSSDASATTVSWKTGASQASVRRRAIVLRIEVSCTTSTSPGRGGSSGRRCRRRRRGLLDVLGDDPALGPGPAQRGEVDAALARDATCERRRLDALSPGARWAGVAALPGAAAVELRGRATSRCLAVAGTAPRRRGSSSAGLSVLASLRRAPRRSSAASCERLDGDLLVARADDGDRRPDVDLALRDDDLEQHAVGLRLDLLRDLVRVELVERLALRDLRRLRT